MSDDVLKHICVCVMLQLLVSYNTRVLTVTENNKLADMLWQVHYSPALWRYDILLTNCNKLACKDCPCKGSISVNYIVNRWRK